MDGVALAKYRSFVICVVLVDWCVCGTVNNCLLCLSLCCLKILLTNFDVVGSNDNSLRVWPLDFSSFFLEAEHDGKFANS